MFPAHIKIFGIFKIKDGWEDRGKTGNEYSSKQVVHPKCLSEARVGRENGESFIFCPKCLVKLIEPPEKNS